MPFKRLWRHVVEDLDAAVERDPATESRLEMALASPGLHAVWTHRVSHALWQVGGPLRIPARVLSQVRHSSHHEAWPPYQPRVLA